MVEHIARTPVDELSLLVGSGASALHDYADGNDLRPVVCDAPAAKSYGEQETFQQDTTDTAFIIARLRAVRPDIALSTDFIVGFPGETEREFEATMQLARDVNFASAFSFKYSARPGTPAAAEPCPFPRSSSQMRFARGE